ncbi:hypothetical protein PAXINDRAFT_181754 [Paxillus involutus ATCC 200175]|uniref:Uncharacterized protein n=1 Tax=Paxillus involutus ATCC 200175 TaxID=664439 RepID=A0A0C9T870_PAXIN|nr:hypothetical protein PAXINDRAFT_181754 [Paxillus involutus ATCC 200175]
MPPYRRRTKRSKDSTAESSNTPAVSTTSEPQPSPSKAPPTDPPSDIPMTKSGNRLAPVSPLGSQMPFNKFVYALSLGAVILLGWYVYDMVTVLGRLKEEVGWWGLIIGGSGGQLRGGSGGGTSHGWGSWTGWGSSSSRRARGDGELESRLDDLANALGIPARDVASALKPIVPPASLTSLAAKMKETSGSEAIRVLLEESGAHGGKNDADGGAAVGWEVMGSDDAPEGETV